LDTNRLEVATFLKEFKLIVTQGRGLDVISRQVNIQALIDLGLTEQNRKQEILTLNVQDYCSGPEPDDSRPGNIWIFGRRINGKAVYVKLKIADVGRNKIAKCISFHPAQYFLTYPFKSPQ